MTVVGLNILKISGERKSIPSGKINIANNIAIKTIEKKDLNFGKSTQDGARFVFEFTSKYDPDVGEILLEGEIFYMEDAKKIKDILDMWEKTKRVDSEVMATIINNALNKCNVQALILSQEINLPPPIPLPKVEAQVSAQQAAPQLAAKPAKK